jgi:hypothetical protein
MGRQFTSHATSIKLAAAKARERLQNFTLPSSTDGLPYLALGKTFETGKLVA